MNVVIAILPNYLPNPFIHTRKEIAFDKPSTRRSNQHGGGWLPVSESDDYTEKDDGESDDAIDDTEANHFCPLFLLCMRLCSSHVTVPQNQGTSG